MNERCVLRPKTAITALKTLTRGQSIIRTDNLIADAVSLTDSRLLQIADAQYNKILPVSMIVVSRFRV